MAKPNFSDVDSSIILLEVPAEKAQENFMNTIAKLSATTDLVLLSATRPAQSILSKIESKSKKHLFIIDCVSAASGSTKHLPQVVFVEGATALTAAAVTLNKQLKKLEKAIVIIDSLPSFLIHNKPNIFAQFVHNILTKIRILGLGGIVFSLQDQVNTEVRAEIAQLCDRVEKQ